MAKIQIEQDYLVNRLVEILNISSPSGYTENALKWVVDELSQYADVKMHYTRKGALVARWQGKNSDYSVGLASHVDTLGAMVKEIKPSGRLKLTQLGGYAWNTVENESCQVLTSKGELISGTILLTNGSVHVNKDVRGATRDDDAMEVRLDAKTTSADETQALGINVGDFVFFDPRVVVTNGFVRSRHLDNKAGVVIMLAMVKAVHEAGLQPAQDVVLFFSNFEEVGHGAATGFPDDMEELVAIDMAAIGAGQNSDEYHCSICVKDGSGPYHHGLTTKLRTLAEKNDIEYQPDIYVYYGSDGSAFWRAGGDVKIALIGPGVDASHSYERTHVDALMASTELCVAYVLGGE